MCGAKRAQKAESHTLSVLVDNEPGVLARVVGLFSARSFNIESLTVAEVAHETHLSRITIVTSGTPEVIEQVRHQLERLVPIHSVTDLTLAVRAIERELAMVKVRGKGEPRVEALRLAEAFRAKVIDATTESFIFELTGAPRKIDDFVELMRGIGLVEVSRTGVAAISRGPERLNCDSSPGNVAAILGRSRMRKACLPTPKDAIIRTSVRANQIDQRITFALSQQGDRRGLTR